MQFSVDEPVHFLGAEKGKAGDREFYRVSVSDEKGSVLRLYTTIETYARLSALKFGEAITPVVSVYSTSKGIGLTLVDF